MILVFVYNSAFNIDFPDLETETKQALSINQDQTFAFKQLDQLVGGLNQCLIELDTAVESQLKDWYLESADCQKLVVVGTGLRHELGENVDAGNLVQPRVETVEDQQWDDDLGLALAHDELGDHVPIGPGQELIDLELSPPDLYSHIHLEHDKMGGLDDPFPGTLQLSKQGDNIYIPASLKQPAHPMQAILCYR
jgi:hypothetical protein